MIHLPNCPDDSGGNLADPQDASVVVPPVHPVPVVSSSLHMDKGKPKDGIIYLNDLGNKVMLDKNGRSYPVGVDKVRLRPSTRPASWDRESWSCISRIHQKEIIESYRLEDVKRLEEKGAKAPEDPAETGGSSGSGSVDPGGAASPSVSVPAALPSLLTNCIQRTKQKQSLRKIILVTH